MMFLMGSHTELNKFSGHEDSNFRKVRDVILEMVSDAQQVVDQRLKG